ncbi:MAG: M16 family metallopeptidase [Clostridiaceae bacterium]
MKDLNFNSYVHKLNNGLKVITIKRDTQLASVHIGLKVGAIYESSREKGISHLIEHMLFKGTEKRDNEKLNEELEFLGGQYNAYTDYNCTVYGITALKEELKKGLELLSDMIINSVFDIEELKKEKKVICAEIKASKDDIEDYSLKKIHEAAFDKSPLKHDVAGTEGSVNRISRKMITDYYKSYYTPDNSIITVVSSYDHSEALSMIEEYFSDWQGKRKLEVPIIKESNRPVEKVSHKRDMELSTVTYLYTYHEMGKDMELPLKILNMRLGESSNSILFRELREKRGLAYDVYTYLDMSKNVKSLYIYTAVAKENINETIKTINSCIEDIKSGEIVFNDKTVELMKKVHKTAVLSTLEDPAELGNYVLHQSLENEDIYEYISEMKELEGLRADHIYSVAGYVLNEPTVHILKSL